MKHIKLAIINLGEGYHAVRVLEMSGIERGCGDIYVTKNGVTLRSQRHPEVRLTLNTLYLWGICKDEDSRPFIVESKIIPTIVKAVREFNKAHKGGSEVVSDSHGWEVVE